jgi:hypothetical protein
MKAFKNMLRLWISITSVFGFFGAWSMLAQSFKPATQGQPSSVIAYPTLAALPPISINSSAQSNINLEVTTMIPTPIPMQQPQLQPQPVFPRLLKTGGS